MNTYEFEKLKKRLATAEGADRLQVGKELVRYLYKNIWHIECDDVKVDEELEGGVVELRPGDWATPEDVVSIIENRRTWAWIHYWKHIEYKNGWVIPASLFQIHKYYGEHEIDYSSLMVQDRVYADKSGKEEPVGYLRRWVMDGQERSAFCVVDNGWPYVYVNAITDTLKDSLVTLLKENEDIKRVFDEVYEELNAEESAEITNEVKAAQEGESYREEQML